MIPCAIKAFPPPRANPCGAAARSATDVAYTPRDMPFASIPQAEPVTRRDKRIIMAIGAVIVAVLAGVGIWAVAAPGSYGAAP
jgi:hypothetical protein